MEIFDLYNSIQDELISFNEIISILQSENKYKNLIEALIKKLNTIEFFNLNRLTYTAEQILSFNSSITTKSKKEGIYKKVLKLNKENNENKYIISNDLSSEEIKYKKYICCIHEYERTDLSNILKEHPYFYKLNLPYSKLYDILLKTSSFISENYEKSKEINIEDNFIHHTKFIKTVNSFITANILSVFNNPLGDMIYSYINRRKYDSDIIESKRIIENLNENERYEFIKCLILLRLPFDVKFPNYEESTAKI